VKLLILYFSRNLHCFLLPKYKINQSIRPPILCQ